MQNSVTRYQVYINLPSGAVHMILDTDSKKMALAHWDVLISGFINEIITTTIHTTKIINGEFKECA